MQIHFPSNEIANNAVKRAEVIVPGQTRLARRNMIAQMLGHGSWNQLNSTTNTIEKFCQPDEELSQSVQDKRIEFQASILKKYVICNDCEATQIALAIRASASSTSAPGLNINIETTPRLIFDTSGKDGETPNWKFFKSERTRYYKNPIYEIVTKRENNENDSEYYSQLLNAFNEQPENLDAGVLLINGYMLEKSYQACFESVGMKIEETILNIIPDEFHSSEYKKVKWSINKNRNFLRCIYLLSLLHYKLDNFDKAIFWAQISKEMNEDDTKNEQIIIDDCLRLNPHRNGLEMIILRDALLDNALNEFENNTITGQGH